MKTKLFLGLMSLSIIGYGFYLNYHFKSIDPLILFDGYMLGLVLGIIIAVMFLVNGKKEINCSPKKK